MVYEIRGKKAFFLLGIFIILVMIGFAKIVHEIGNYLFPVWWNQPVTFETLIVLFAIVFYFISFYYYFIYYWEKNGDKQYCQNCDKDTEQEKIDYGWLCLECNQPYS